MEQDLLRLRPLESQGPGILHTHFFHLREKSTPINMTRDLQLIAQCALTWTVHPTVLLKTMGILFFDGIAAFNISLLAASLTLCRARTLTAFAREGWKEVAIPEKIAPVVAVNELKLWTGLRIPTGTELCQFVASHPNLIATEQRFGLNKTPDEVLIGPGLPPHDGLSEPPFPLVPIFFQTVTEMATEIASMPPRTRRMEYRLGDQITIE
jgi:hypothetical protein